MRSEEISGDVYELDGEVYKPRKAIIGMCMWWQYHLRVVLLQFWLVVMLLCFWLLILIHACIAACAMSSPRNPFPSATLSLYLPRAPM